jgi:replication-associated recombination protein RarA
MSLFDGAPQFTHPTQDGLSFPESLTEKYRPRAIADFIGLEKPKRLLANLAANPRAMALLFKGSSGTGKTTLAQALAAAIPAELHHIPSQNCNLETIQRVRMTCQYVPMAGKKMHLVLVDEADCMSGPAKIAFLSILDSTNRAPNTIFIFTCNSTDKLNENDETKGRFLSRCTQVDFSSYGIAKDAAELLARIWDAETAANPNRPNFARIVKDANNNIRAAINSLESEIMML